MNETNREKLNRLGREWSALPPDVEPRQRERLASEIFCLILHMFPSRTDAVGEFFIKNWPKYGADKGELFGFVSRQLKYRSKDIFHQDRGDHRETEEKTKERIWVSNQSLNAPIEDDEDGDTFLDQLEGKMPIPDPEDSILYSDTAVQFIILMLSLPERLNGRAANPTRLNYYRLFFTDTVVDILHRGCDARPFEAHERELFDHALKIGFLDFMLLEICRRISEIRSSPVKPYGELVEGRPMKEPGHPMPNDVYLRYLETVEGLSLRSAGTISNQRAAYEQFLRESLC